MRRLKGQTAAVASVAVLHAFGLFPVRGAGKRVSPTGSRAHGIARRCHLGAMHRKRCERSTFLSMS